MDVVTWTLNCRGLLVLNRCLRPYVNVKVQHRNQKVGTITDAGYDKDNLDSQIQQRPDQ